MQTFTIFKAYIALEKLHFKYVVFMFSQSDPSTIRILPLELQASDFLHVLFLYTFNLKKKKSLELFIHNHFKLVKAMSQQFLFCFDFFFFFYDDSRLLCPIVYTIVISNLIPAEVPPGNKQSTALQRIAWQLTRRTWEWKHNQCVYSLEFCFFVVVSFSPLLQWSSCTSSEKV